MKSSNLFFILVFVVIVIVIINMGTLTDSLLVASLLANCVAVYVNILKLDKKEGLELEKKPILDVPQVIEKSPYRDYLGNYQKWSDERATYEDTAVIPAVPDMISTSSVDLANTVMARGRARDKTCLDGAITKTSDYFKYHYGNDFVESENKPWWGRNEY